MRYFRATILKEIDSGKRDELGNILYEYDEVQANHCRVTEWTVEDIEIYGRPITSSARKVIARPFGGVDGVSKIRIGEETYNIHTIKDLGRWILLIVQGYRI